MKASAVAGPLLVFAVALAVYLPALRNGFAYDDVAIIQLNSRVHSISNIPALFTQSYWQDTELALYRPVTTSTFALDWTISGGQAWWFQLVNALLNATVSVLVLLLLARLLPGVAAVAGALFFALHPVHVEAVANIVGRAELLASAFMLGALLLWPPRGARREWRRIAGVLFLFGCALLSKESAIMLPALLMLLDAAMGELRPGGGREWLRLRGVSLALLLLTAGGYLTVRAAVLGGVAPSRVDAALEVTTGPDRLLTALQIWPTIVRLLLFPVTLLADYGPRILMPATTVTPGAAAGALILAGLVGAGVQAWRRGHSILAMAFLWLPVALLPVSNLVIPIGVIVAERTLYLPSFAVAMLAGSIIAGLQPRQRGHAAIVVGVVLVLFAARTITRIPDWRSTDSIMAALLRDRPDSFRANWHHARLATIAGSHDIALQRYVHAVHLWPFRERLVLETIRAAGRAGELPYARDLARYATGRWPVSVEAARLYSAATLDMGDTTAARAILNRALATMPNDSLLLRMHEAINPRNGQ